MSHRPHHNGEYTGKLTLLNDREATVVTTYGKYDEEHNFDLALSAMAQVADEDFELGDQVTLFVEFGSYKCVWLERTEMTPRAIHERLLVIERKLGIRDDG